MLLQPSQRPAKNKPITLYHLWQSHCSVCCCAFSPRKLEIFVRCSRRRGPASITSWRTIKCRQETSNNHIKEHYFALVYQTNAAKKRAALTRTPHRGDWVEKKQSLNTPKREVKEWPIRGLISHSSEFFLGHPWVRDPRFDQSPVEVWKQELFSAPKILRNIFADQIGRSDWSEVGSVTARCLKKDVREWRIRGWIRHWLFEKEWRILGQIRHSITLWLKEVVREWRIWGQIRHSITWWLKEVVMSDGSESDPSLRNMVIERGCRGVTDLTQIRHSVTWCLKVVREWRIWPTWWCEKSCQGVTDQTSNWSLRVSKHVVREWRIRWCLKTLSGSDGSEVMDRRIGDN